MVLGFFKKEQERNTAWWREGTVYQVYPSSFKDSNGDGIGDIPGIISKLDYIKSVGTDIVWLSPHYKSPQVDMGYDISDYKAIHEPYGTFDDCIKLIQECHNRGLKIIFDLVVNHTSDQHEWFKQSRSSKSNPKRDWYIWKPAKYDEQGNRIPPNNWESYFGGSAWEWDEETQEYYLHLFAKEQPDINWRNLQAREAIYKDAILFWLDRGIDGFRIDTVQIYSKPEDFPDAPERVPGQKLQNPSIIVETGPQLHEILQEMNRKAFSKYDIMTVGEGSPPSLEKTLEYVSSSRHEIDMLFSFDFGALDHREIAHTLNDIDMVEMKETVYRWQRLVGKTDGWTTFFLENHDSGRSISRFASDATPEARTRSTKFLAVLQATMSGTLYLYQGQEIGIPNLPDEVPIDEYKDVNSINYYNAVKEDTNNDPDALKKAKKYLQKVARDHARSPMQWDASKHSGFTEGEPWMIVNPIYPEVNVAAQEWDADSGLNFWRHILRFRREHKDVMVYGTLEILDKENTKVFTYTKASESGRTFLVALNFTDKAVDYNVNQFASKSTLLLSSIGNVHHQSGSLQPLEAVIYEI